MLMTPRPPGSVRLLVLPVLIILLGLGLLDSSVPVDSAVVTASNPTPVSTRTHTPVIRKGPFAVVLVVDAARFDEFDLAHMPNLAKLVVGGTSYENAFVGQLPSITETSHATIGTGVLPKHHLILGDTWRVPGTEQMSPNLLDSNLTRTGYIGQQIQQTGSPTLAALVRQRWPDSIAVSVSGHKIYAADGMGAGAADFVAFGQKDARGHFVPAAIPGHAPSQAIMTSSQLDLPAYPRVAGLEDNWTTTLAEKFLFKYHPRLMMINLPEVDTVGHISGTDATVMEPLMATVDREIGRLVAAYGRAGMLAQTYFVITSDHGMIPAVHTVDSEVIKSTIKKAGGLALYVGHGDYSSIWLKNADAIPRVAAALSKANIPSVPAVYMRNPAGRYILVSPPSRFADSSVKRAQTDLLGSFVSSEAPDIVLLYDENTITMTPVFAQVGRKGDHGGATWGAQHIPLVISGPGLKRGYISTYPARLVDIAPTVETLLGATPAHQDGVPLADSMIKPPPAAAISQLKRQPNLSFDVHALSTEAILRPNVSKTARR